VARSARMCIREKLNATNACILRGRQHHAAPFDRRRTFVHQEDAKVTFSLKVFSKLPQGSIGWWASAGTTLGFSTSIR
jgi:hypothetical protein